MKTSKRYGLLLLLLELGVLCALMLTVLLVLRNQVDRGKTPAELADAARAVQKNADSMRPAEDWELLKYYGIGAEEAEDLVLFLPASNMDAAELCVLKFADDDAAASALKNLRKRHREQISLFENYGMEQMKLLDQARVFSVGPYAVLISDEAAGDAEAAIRRAARK